MGDSPGSARSTGLAGPTLSVIVVEHASAAHLPACLKALERDGGERVEIIVVDNASPTSCDALHARFSRVRFVHLRRNLGFAGGCQVGASRARAPLIATVNPDAQVESGWLTAVERAFQDPSVGVVGSKLLALDGVTLQHAGGALRPNGRSEHLGRGERDRGQYDGLRDVQYVCGAALATRRALVESHGFFSPVYHPAYYEDAELCVRARRHGWRVVVASDARVRHVEAASSGGVESDAYLGRYHTGRVRFMARNMSPFGWLRAAPAEAWLVARMRRRERRLVRRAYRHGLLSAWDERRGQLGPGDIRLERPPEAP
ncbi:MAG: glycosyltransferase family 2 protein [Sandaracinaceae bacterium]